MYKGGRRQVPWWTPELSQATDEQRRLFKAYIDDDSPETMVEYLAQRSKVKKMIRLAMQEQKDKEAEQLTQAMAEYNKKPAARREVWHTLQLRHQLVNGQPRGGTGHTAVMRANPTSDCPRAGAAAE